MNNLKTKALSIFALSALSFSAYATEYTTYYVDDNGEIQETTVDVTSGVTSRDVSPTEDINYDYVGISTSGTAVDSGGGALRNAVATNDITVTGDFVANSFIRTTDNNRSGGGALYNYTGCSITIDGDFIGNMFVGGNGNSTNAGGGAICNYNGEVTVTGDFVSNTSAGAGSTGGGAIFNYASGTVNLYDSSFIANYAAGTGGGAIYNLGTVNLYASSSNVYFVGNFFGTTSNAIYNTGTVNFTATNGNEIVVNDGINGTGVLNILSGTTVFNNTVANQTITVSKGATLELGSYAGGETVSYSTISTAGVTTDYTQTTSAASANLSSSTLIVNGTLSLVASESSTITLGTTTFDGGVLALDLSDIFGSFDLTIVGTSLDFDDLGLNILLADGSIESTTFVDGTYDLTTEGYADSYITIASTEAGYSITGVVSGAAVPEPSTYAMIFGVVALGFAAYRRRK